MQYRADITLIRASLPVKRNTKRHWKNQTFACTLCIIVTFGRQWDPHHTPSGGKVGMSRAIQLGLRKCTEFAKNVSNGGWIVRIDDISEFCHEQKQRMDQGQEFFIPCETFYQVSNVMTCSRIELS